MKTSAFELWCDRIQMPTATRDFLAHLRASPPARRVQGRLFNVCGTFASRKMGVSLQFESHTVELWAIYTSGGITMACCNAGGISLKAASVVSGF